MDVVFIAHFPTNRRFFKEIVAYQELFYVVTLLASANNHEEDEKIKLNYLPELFGDCLAF